MTMERQIHTGWRRVLSVLAAVVVLAAGAWSFAVLPVGPALAALVVALVLAFGFLRRVRWTGEQWEGHVASKRQSARELLRADEGQRTRPP